MNDLIARLYPYGDVEYELVKTLIAAAKDTRRYVPRTEEDLDPPEYCSRETTAPPYEEERQQQSNDTEEREKMLSRKNHLQLRFSDELVSGKGIMFGRDATKCDIVLPSLCMIGRQHCYLTFDDRGRLILRDESRYGTTVIYDTQGDILKRNFTWILGGDEFVNYTKVIVIQIHSLVKFQIVVTKHDISSATYMRNLSRFRESIQTNEEFPLGHLRIQSADLTAPGSRSGPPTTKDSIILVQRNLGSGAFGSVNLMWNVSNGARCASKLFYNAKEFDWREEARRMGALSHPHIVDFMFHLEEPFPQIVMEYVPNGDLWYQCKREHFSTRELMTILEQALSALDYLHALCPQVVHRDIKPENILVQSRVPMHIKLADFGISKASESLHTVCGTEIYAAPEILRYYGREMEESYTAAVDIWSLGVVILQFGSGLPAQRPKSGEYGTRWCKKLVASLHSWESDELEVLNMMIVMKPSKRATAKICLHHTQDALRRFSTPTPEQYRRTSLSDPTYQESEGTRPHNHNLIDGYAAIIPLDNHGSYDATEVVCDVSRSSSIHDSEIEGYIIKPRRSTRSAARTIIHRQQIPSTQSHLSPLASNELHESHIARRMALQRSLSENTQARQKRGRSKGSSPVPNKMSPTKLRQHKRKDTKPPKSGEQTTHYEGVSGNLIDWATQPGFSFLDHTGPTMSSGKDLGQTDGTLYDWLDTTDYVAAVVDDGQPRKHQHLLDGAETCLHSPGNTLLQRTEIGNGRPEPLSWYSFKSSFTNTNITVMNSKSKFEFVPDPNIVGHIVFCRNENGQILLCKTDTTINITQILKTAGWSSELKICKFIQHMELPILRQRLGGPLSGDWVDASVARAICTAILPELVPALDLFLRENHVKLSQYKLLVPIPFDAIRSVIVDQEKPNSIRLTADATWANVHDIFEVSGIAGKTASTILKKNNFYTQIQNHAWGSRSQARWTPIENAIRICQTVNPGLVNVLTLLTS